MNNSITDVMIHTRTHLSEVQFANLREQVYADHGVVSLSRNVHTPKFLMVIYNAAKTSAGSILKSVRKQGCDATLIGI